ncbi:MAG: 50S ribosomal protein L10 [Anaeroplasmataceae bacterium]
MTKDVILKKIELVNELKDKFNSSKAFISFDYQGLTVSKFMQLRNDFRNNGCEVFVLKNNISRRAAIECGYQEFADQLTGPKAIVFSVDDIIAPAKMLFEFAKENQQVKVANGVVDKEVYDYAKLEALATLPSYETLLTQVAAGMLGTVRQLAVGLNMICEQKEA